MAWWGNATGRVQAWKCPPGTAIGPCRGGCCASGQQPGATLAEVRHGWQMAGTISPNRNPRKADPGTSAHRCEGKA